MNFDGMTKDAIRQHIDTLKVRLQNVRTDMEAIRIRRSLREAENELMKWIRE